MDNKQKYWIYIIIVVVIMGAVGYMIVSGVSHPAPTSGEVRQLGSGQDLKKSDTYAQTALQNVSASGTAATTTQIIKPSKNLMHTITLETNKGTIVFETYDADAPKASGNFVTLAQKGFYDGIIFHRVIKDFMIQGGDPTGTGRGGPGYQFEDELNPATVSYKAGYARGTVAMANSGPNTNGSQFFIMHKDVPLPHAYTIFGKVIKGLDVVDAIAATQTDESDKPLQEVVIKKVIVSEIK
jgi:cyclophilin family peptidyl-prolyl cis-trans isomerase